MLMYVLTVIKGTMPQSVVSSYNMMVIMLFVKKKLIEEFSLPQCCKILSNLHIECYSLQPEKLYKHKL